MVAGQANLSPLAAQSFLSISRDGGQSWVENPGATAGIWIGADVSGDGTRIAAVQFQGGGLFMSVDNGTTFTPVALPATVSTAPPGPSFESVTLTQDGSRVVAAIRNGPVIVGDVGATGAVTWLTPTGLPTSAGWRSVDSSASGDVIVAVAEDPVVFVSRDGGLNWNPLAVIVGADPILDQNWYRVKVSADGLTIAMAGNLFGGNEGNGIYVSKDSGITFERAIDLVGDYTAIAMSADGGVIGATLSNPSGTGTGQVLLSTNGGTSFAPLPVNVGGTPAADTDWRAITMNADATRMAVAAGRFLTNGTGQIYLSTGTAPPPPTTTTPTSSTPTTTTTTLITPTSSTPSGTSTTSTLAQQ
ncbi:exo-alpha-sialidase [Ramlibacter henchirensis]|uniref:Exo-alpha-sialidase n=1 Tax=Ramlibacter henchirensis TaxID=204072 RepID=A0A4Z0C2X9_9BURK|nr:exo-alpha-sialidase [Ramlibacter henchirensis]TFZ05551.1 exo-alpha-sialidase [Ramlibacter henchirensis]